MYVGMAEGTANRCARMGCKAAVTYRVILGQWNVQVYCCTGDLKWALDLDHTPKAAGEDRGWFYGYPSGWVTTHDGKRVPSTLECRQPIVDATARYGASKRLPDVPRDAIKGLGEDCPDHGLDDRFAHSVCGACVSMGRAPKGVDRTDEMREY